MRNFRWIVVSAVGVVIFGVVALLAAQGGARTEPVAPAAMPRSVASPPAQPQDAQAPVQEAQQTRPPAAAPAAPARPAAPEAPRRVETTQYNSWVVTCEDTVGGTAKKRCAAELRLVNQDRGTVLNWQIGLSPDGRFVTAIHIPSALRVKNGDKTVGGPISIPSGIELKFGNGAIRRLSFVTCGPQQCVAEALIDDAFIKDAATNTKVTITVQTPGGAIPLDLPIKGIDKAISLTR